MELIETKCPNCGSEIQINKEEKTGVCVHCNSTFLVDDAIKKYITNNSYNIEHATIIKNDFGDDVLRNEVDKYIAQYNLGNFDMLEEIVDELKKEFPHKGLARIVILHYQMTYFFAEIGGLEIFKKEFETIEERYNNYNPKKSKHVPPLTSFLSKADIVEMQYYEDIDDLMTDEEKESYDDIVNTTIGYITKLNYIKSFNDKMREKFKPFENTLEQKKLRKEQRKLIYQKLKKYRFLVAFVSVIVVISMVTLINFCTLQAIKSKREFISVSNLNYLDSPIKMNSNGVIDTKKYGSYNVTFKKVASYKITGRVAGTHKYLIPIELENQIFNFVVALTWGDFSSSETTKSIQWAYSLFDNNFTYKQIRGDINYYLSTNKLVPANKDVKKLFKVIKSDDVIQIEGYLVNILAQSNDKMKSINTSTTLADQYVEYIYVTSIKWVNQNP